MSAAMRKVKLPGKSRIVMLVIAMNIEAIN